LAINIQLIHDARSEKCQAMTMLVLLLGTVILKMNICVWAAADSSTRVIWTIY